MQLQRLHPDATLDVERGLVARVTRACALRHRGLEGPSLQLRIAIEGPDGRLDALIEAATLMEAVHLFEALRDVGYGPAPGSEREALRSRGLGPVHRIYRPETGWVLP